MTYLEKERLALSATEEIYDTVHEQLKEKKVYGCGNYWLNDEYNLFVETETDWSKDNLVMERMGYFIKLEKYANDGEDLIDESVRDGGTYTLDKVELYLKITDILKDLFKQ